MSKRDEQIDQVGKQLADNLNRNVRKDHEEREPRDPRWIILWVLLFAAGVVGFFDSIATGILGAALAAALFLTLPIE